MVPISDLAAFVLATDAVAREVQSRSGRLQWIWLGDSEHGGRWRSFCGHYSIDQDGNKYDISTPEGCQRVKFERVAFWLPEFHWQWHRRPSCQVSPPLPYEEAKSRCFAWVFHGEAHSEEKDDIELILEWIAKAE